MTRLQGQPRDRRILIKRRRVIKRRYLLRRMKKTIWRKIY